MISRSLISLIVTKDLISITLKQYIALNTFVVWLVSRFRMKVLIVQCICDLNRLGYNFIWSTCSTWSIYYISNVLCPLNTVDREIPLLVTSNCKYRYFPSPINTTESDLIRSKFRFCFCLICSKKHVLRK